MNNKRKTYTVVIIPDSKGGRTFSMCLSRPVIIMLLAIVCIIAGVSSLLFVKSAAAAKKLQYFNALKRDNDFLIKENKQLRLAYDKATRIDSITAYLEKLAALTKTPEKEAFSKRAVTIKQLESFKDTIKKAPIEKAFPDQKAEKENNEEPSFKSSTCMLPVEGWITQPFTNDTSQGEIAHPGIDIAAAEGMTIKAPSEGTVIAVETDLYYGNLIIIKHDEEFITRYGHCAKVFVTKGEKVERGQTIALVGNTGHSTAPHLHYEVIRNGRNVNPLEYISSGKK